MRAADELGKDEQPGWTKPREGGFTVPVPQSPPLRAVPIAYLKEEQDLPRPASRLDVEPKDAGIAGAKMAIEENNAGGRFLGDFYSLDPVMAASPEEVVEAAQKLLDSGHNYFVVDASAGTLLKLSDWGKDKDAIFFNVRATDISLRQEDCRANVVHIVPDRFMLADALAQYLVTKKWTNWLLVHGSTEADLAYADAVKRAAGRFGASIVDTREYKDVSGGRRDDIGVIPPGRQASLSGSALAATPDYQIIVVADEGQQFGPFMPYRGGGDARPVAGTTGLVATTWSAGHEKWGATQANNNFEKDFGRLSADRLPGLCGGARSGGSGEPQSRQRFRQGRGFHSRARASARALQGHQAAIPALGRAVPPADPDRHRQSAGLRLAAKGLPACEPSGDRGRSRSASTSLRASARCNAAS